MRVLYSLIIERIKSSFWFLPAVVSIAIVLILFWLQTFKIESDSSFTWLLLYDASPSGARSILSSIATSVMTVVGVLFSITIVVLQQASTQYTPRVIQNFLRSTPSQVVLGFYLGTFVYCLLLLRKIRDEDADVESAIPQLAMSAAIVLAITCLCLLIYFVQHITSSIQSARIVDRITDNTLSTLENIVSDRAENSPERSPAELVLPLEKVVYSKGRGYVQAIEWKRFDRDIKVPSWLVHVLHRPGEYVQEGEPILRIQHDQDQSNLGDSEVGERIILSTTRTHAQDPDFGVQQLVDIALRALSPGINDPSTAMEALHGLTAIMLKYVSLCPMVHLMELNERQFVHLRKATPDYFVGLCYDQVLQFSEEQGPVLELIKRGLGLARDRSSDTSLDEALDRRLMRVTTLIAKHHSQNPGEYTPAA